jgi:hypothetical protein
VPVWHATFLKVLPAVRHYAGLAFRHLDSECREESIQNVVCLVCAAVASLAERNKLDVAHPSTLARYAIARTRDGRIFGCPMNCKDVSSELCQRQGRATMERLDNYDTEEDCWREILVEDRRAGPARIAGIRLDFSAWRRTLPRRARNIVDFLGIGNRSIDAASKFGVSISRVSQLRRELWESWQRFISGRIPSIS